MTAPPPLHTPGGLVSVRGREWIVLPGSSTDVLRLRPLTGSEGDTTLVHTGLEPDVGPATFPSPAPLPEASQETALLLRDALLLSLRRGAGPFRSLGNVALEPRAYQLVPLLMALRLDPIRLLIADDVGIGKTIEAGLIARELYDRGEIARLTVLCLPHLVDQWVRELSTRFHLQATPVTATSAARLERELPINESIFTVHPVTVVSLDYIKSERRRHDFVRACPEFVVVDEAHTCTNPGAGRHLRYELLKALAEDPTRHLVLLTATPHSGDEEAFYHLLGLLNPQFESLRDESGAGRDKLRERLARHFVQRQRQDLDEWQDGTVFPRRETAELTYRLSGAWQEFFDDVLAYCAEVVTEAGADARRQRLTFWGMLALMRCVSSSPAAAVQALRTRIATSSALDDDSSARERVFDGGADTLTEDDVEPAADTGDPRVQQLVDRAEALRGERGDPKLALIVRHVEQLLADGFAPVVFCRYVATAHYIGEHLQQRLGAGTTVAVVTGELATEERVLRIEELGTFESRVLVATDCLSEGVNLQHAFDAVVHADLNWNPTRHAQREGRVDRYGQPSPVVRATLIYGENNPVDGAVLQVILRKAERIRRELGVPVPMPDENHTLTEALLQAVLLRQGGRGAQRELFDVNDLPAARELEVQWTDLAAKAKRNRTIFAQRGLKPDQVLPEWSRAQAALGSQADVARFVRRSMARLNAGPEPLRGGFRAPLEALPPAIRERLAAEGLAGAIRIDFAEPAGAGARFVHRSHPLVTVLAEGILERALLEGGEDDVLGRVGRAGAWRTQAVARQVTILLLRLRYQLTTGGMGRSSVLLVEEALPVALVGRQSDEIVVGAEAIGWLEAPVGADLTEAVRMRVVAEALQRLDARRPELEAVASRQALSLLADHRRVREAAGARGKYEVRALTPVDIIGAFVLVPA